MSYIPINIETGTARYDRGEISMTVSLPDKEKMYVKQDVYTIFSNWMSGRLSRGLLTETFLRPSSTEGFFHLMYKSTTSGKMADVYIGDAVKKVIIMKKNGVISLLLL